MSSIVNIQLGWRAQQRALAWMVYLNDVEEGGETEFLYQQLKIKPSKGRVVIWPRTIYSPTQR